MLFDSSKAPGLITDVLFFDAAYVERSPKVIDAVMRGYLDGLAYLRAKPDEARRIVAKATSVTAAEVKEQQKGVYNIPPAEMSSYFVKRDDSKSLYHVGAGIGDILVKHGQIPATPAIESSFDLRFVSALSGAK